MTDGTGHQERTGDRSASRWASVVPATVFAAVACLVLVVLVRADAGGATHGEPTTPAPAMAPECAGADSLEFDCFEARLLHLVQTEGADVALRDLEHQSTVNGFVFAACHQLTHRVGRAAGEQRGQVAFDEGGSLCASGYYHGVSEAVMAQLGPDRVERDAASVCADQRSRHPGANSHYNCVHGMGHGFMGVFESDMFRSLRACESLADGWEREQCYGGVFMENMSALTHPTRPTAKNLRVDEPLYPCTEVAPQFKAPCYEKQTAYAVYLSNDDFGAVFALCAATPEQELRQVCYQGLGGDAAVHSSKYLKREADQIRAVRTLCGLGPDEVSRGHCLAGAVHTSIRDRGQDDRRSAAFCADIEVASTRELCDTTRQRARDELLGAPRDADAAHGDAHH